MNEQEKHQTRIGIPKMSVGPDNETEAEDPTHRTVSQDSQAGPRKGDTGIGRSVMAPEELGELTDKQRQAIGQAMQEDLEKQADQILSRSPGIRLPRFLFRPTFILLAAALGSLLGLFIATEIISVIDKLANLPLWAQYTWYTAIGIFLTVILIAGLRLVGLYIKLARTPQVPLKGLDELARRQSLRKIATREMGRAHKQLVAYVETYPIGEQIPDKPLLEMGFTDQEISKLIKQRESLLNPDSTPDAEQWLNKFNKDFQPLLDKCADRKIRSYALRVGIKTAVTPTGIIDTLIVTASSFTMIGDLCKIYNLRMGTLSTAVVMVRAFAFAYLAAEFEQIFEQVSDSIFEGAEGFSSAVARVALPNIAEGKANAFLIWRLGKATKSLLKPMNPK